MEFREGHWANLVFVSTLGEEMSAEEIAEAWDIDKEKISKKSIIREADRLKQVRFFEETGEKFLARTDSQAFKTEVEAYFRHESEKDIHEVELKLFTRVMQEMEVRKKAFDIESVTDFYFNDPEDAKKNPLAVFEGLLYSLDYILGNERTDEIEYNTQVLIDKLEKLERESPELLQKI